MKDILKKAFQFLLGWGIADFVMKVIKGVMAKKRDEYNPNAEYWVAYDEEYESTFRAPKDKFLEAFDSMIVHVENTDFSKLMDKN